MAFEVVVQEVIMRAWFELNQVDWPLTMARNDAEDLVVPGCLKYVCRQITPVACYSYDCVYTREF